MARTAHRYHFKRNSRLALIEETNLIQWGDDNSLWRNTPPIKKQINKMSGRRYQSKSRFLLIDEGRIPPPILDRIKFEKGEII